jgi:hypothetical protein
MATQVALSEEQIGRLSSAVQSIADRFGLNRDGAISLIEESAGGPDIRPRRSVPEFAAGLLAVRTRRNELLGISAMRDPAWDMLLDLYIATHEHRQVSVSSLCYASGVPSTTALRHVDRLERCGLIERIADSEDRRRLWVQAKPATLERIHALLSRMQNAA